MNQMWNEVQPVDRYQVVSNGLLHEYDRKVISFLYQPLIGTNCFSLYSILWNELEENRLWSDEWTHYHLMNFLALNLKEIYEARLKLEGIGLLKTYVKKAGDERSFIYELQPPLSPEQFFTDGMLNVFLYRQLGHSHFQRLKKFFSDRAIEKDAHQEITRTFQDVFTTNGNQFIQDVDAQNASTIDNHHQYISRKNTSTIKVNAEDFNFELLFAGLHELLIPKKAITKQVKEAISNLAFLYNVNAVEMKNLLLSSLNSEQEIDINELRKATRDWYQLEHADEVPKLVDRVQPSIHRDVSEETKTQEDKLIYYLEITSPRQLLIDISDGAEPSKGDLQAIEEIMFQQQLPAGVVNVLIQYVMLKTDMKLTKNYLEKIASHWSRKKVKTVKEAMELAKNEHRQYQQWADNKKDKKTIKKPTIRTEKLPKWFTEKDEIPKENIDIQDEESIEEKRRRLESIQKKYKNGR
ncbi:replication initiation and membrane attachment family protein [Heyndrickxia sp. NPDC080065]|uniref:replication initiation and membrane attachment family protein n=1 Tax=Heyndrickxia sp. NPDC080065 TaxID=3390568 RepID=UPI003CFC0322